MKKIHQVFIITAFMLSGATFTCLAQRTGTATTKSNLSITERQFIQDAINRNNEAMALAQAALQQSKKKEVQQIAGQLMNDHRAAQKKLYAIAGMADTVPYNRSVMQPVVGATKLPTTDNLNSRRNRTVVSITDNSTPANTATTNTITTNNTTGNTIAGTANTQSRTGGDTASRFGVNQTFNGNTAIDNANGINNSNRTDLASASGRATELNTPANSQNPATGNQVLNNGINSNNTATTVPANNGNTSSNISTNATANTGTNLPDFPSRVSDTVRQTGSTAGFQNPGTNLSFPGNERYSKTTPNTAPNNNAGSDYGVTGVTVNNAQTNALNTAPYADNDINSNSVQTGRVLPTSDPAAVVNSSTASMRNKDVGYNNASTGSNGTVQQSGQLAADNANGVNRRTSEVINSNNSISNNTAPNTNRTTATTTTGTNATTNNGAVLAGRARNGGRIGTDAAATQPIVNNPVFYSEPFATSQTVNTLRTASPDAFDAQWAVQMNANQQAAVTLYQFVLRKVANPQVKAYLNTTLPLLRGHQFALRQWQAKQ